MNSFLFSAIALCLAASCALAQYQSAPAYGNGYQQRKLAPSPQHYGSQQSYGEQQSYDSAPAYRAPSSAAVSQYDERTPAASYSKPAAPAYGRQAASGYGAQAAGYAKPAPKYEEPYYPPMPFAWGYDINDGYGGAQYHKENGDEYGKRTGSYGYTDANGIYRQVDYVADEHGFRATIKTNEPGTANESPADVELHAYEPPSNYYAPSAKDSYSAPAKSYAAAPATYSPAPAAYAAPAQSYGQSSYSAPRASSQSYGRPTSGYGKQSSGHGHGYNAAAAPRQQQYNEQAQYSSSVIVPVYQKAQVAPKAVQAPIKPKY